MNNSFSDETLPARFDSLAADRDYWQKKNDYYYHDQQRYFRYLIPKGQAVLEIGCGLGDLLQSVEPRYGVGIDFSRAMIEQAQKRHSHLNFHVMQAESLDLNEKFDAIILSDVIGHLPDIQAVFEQVHTLCHSQTRIYISFYNLLWEPLLKFAESIGVKMPQKLQNWLSLHDIQNLLSLANFDTVKTEQRLLLPKKIPLLSLFFNQFLAFIPGIRKLCLSNYLVAKPIGLHKTKEYSVTIVIPCRNEKGNIESAIQRMPRFGSSQEIIFMDGHSTDGTIDEIKRVIAAYPEWDIKVDSQEGIGKGDAVRKAYAQANKDILMILDADLTVPPEDLPKFYVALRDNKGDFINGCRLIYPMEGQAMRFLNMLGNKFFALVFSWLLNQRIKDTLCGTKVLFREDYEKIAADRDYFGDFDPFGDFDLLFGASKQNLKITEMPIRYHDRTYGETNISRFAHGWLLLKMAWFAFFKLKAIS